MVRIGAFVLAVAISSAAYADEAAVANGWRGNGTGQWPASKASLEWHRIPKGVATLLKTAANPADEASGVPLAKGIVAEWMVAGHFAAADAGKQIDESKVEPRLGDKAGAAEWKKFAAPVDDRWAFGPATPPTANLATVLGPCKPNETAYAHAYIHSPKGGEVDAIVDHTHGMAAFLNGKELYRSADRKVSLGSYYPFSRVEFGTDDIAPSPRFRLNLKSGWNRLLLKLTSFTREDEGWNRLTFLLRIVDLPTVEYESKNIRWMTELPQRSNASPIVVGDRIFVMAEPDELICVDKRTGEILWRASNSYFDALTPADHLANPAFRERIIPLREAIRTERDFVKRLALRTKLQRALVAIDAERFAWKADGHFEAHFGIVGFTSPSPVSDGKHVWVWCGNGVAACYNLKGERQWIRRIPSKNLTYSSSPALADGVFAVYLGKLYGLDAATGEILWEQKRINHSSGSLLAARIAGVPVFINSIGHIIRARDGRILYEERNREGGASSWSPGVVHGDVVCLPRYGARHLLLLDFSAAKGDAWEAVRTEIGVPDGVPREPNGKRRDRSTAGSPLLCGSSVTTVDIYSTMYSFDVKSKKIQYYQDTELNGYFHYNAVPVAASPTQIGDRIVIQDNQGVALVLEQGPKFSQVAKSHIGTIVDRWWPVPLAGDHRLCGAGGRRRTSLPAGRTISYCIGKP